MLEVLVLSENFLSEPPASIGLLNMLVSLEVSGVKWIERGYHPEITYNTALEYYEAKWCLHLSRRVSKPLTISLFTFSLM